LILAIISAYIPYAWLDDRVKSRGREIDRLLPVAVGRITAGLLAGGSVPEVLQKTGESLDMESPNPLTPELMLTAAELRSKERQQPCAACGLLAFNFTLKPGIPADGYNEAGGGNAEVLMQTPSVCSRSWSQQPGGSQGRRCLLSARIIPVVLLIVLSS
jgi:hypothetical protein